MCDDCAIHRLHACAGEWRGTNMLVEPGTNERLESESTLVITSLIGGRFVRIDYTWSYRGDAQEGSILVGYQPDADIFTAHWIDSWHMGNGVLASEGKDADGAIDVVGSYGDPTGPDWHWRTVIAPTDGSQLELTMFNILPDGTEQLAVEATYRRA